MAAKPIGPGPGSKRDTPPFGILIDEDGLPFIRDIPFVTHWQLVMRRTWI